MIIDDTTLFCKELQGMEELGELDLPNKNNKLKCLNTKNEIFFI